MSDDDKRPDWKKGFEAVKLFYHDARKNATKLNFLERAEHGRETLVHNSKQTWNELQGIFERMTKNHNAALIGMRTYLKHKVYIYPTLKKRILLLTVLTAWLVVRTRFFRFNSFHRVGGFFLLSNMLIPDFDDHKKRLSMEMNRNLKILFKFLD
jgi:hypothetical protein